MTFVPAAREVFSDETPIHGSSDEVTPLGVFARDVADDAARFGRFTADARNALLGQQSLGVTRLVSKLTDGLQPGAGALSSSALSGQRALDRYAAAIEQIHQEARGLLAQVSVSLDAIRAAAGAIDAIASEIGVPGAYAWDEAAPSAMPEPVAGALESVQSPAQLTSGLSLLRYVHEEPWRAASLRWRNAIDDVQSARRKWNALTERRRQSEAALRAALYATEIGQLISLGPAAGEASVQAIATAIAGDAWGGGRDGDGAAPGSARSHPLLARLIGSRSGANVWDSPPDPVAVAAAWAVLSEEERQTLIAEVPWVIGNLPGVPFSARDAANREQLEYFIVHQGGLGPNRRAAVDEIMKVLEKERLRIAERGVANPPVQVVAFDVAGAVPRAAIGYGELDSAKNLNWAVPGMLNDANEGLAGWDRASRNLYRAQGDELRHGGRGTEGNALIAYFEYDTPNLVTVLSSETARDASFRLAAELDGAFATRQENASLPNHGVLAHSYGTPVAANALLLTRFPVQSLTLIGSAGLDGGRVTSLSELNIDRDAAGQPRVFSTMATADDTAPLGSQLSGRLQPNPQAARSVGQAIDGAQLFSADGLGELAAVTGHGIMRDDGGGYLDKRTQSLDSVAKLTIGEAAEVTGGLKLAKKDGPSAAERISEMTLGGP